MLAHTPHAFRSTRPILAALSLALLAGASWAQPLPGERALLLEYGTTQLQVGNGVNDLASADLDGDGDLDVVSVNEAANQVRLLFNRGNGVFSMQSINVGGSPAAVGPADLDGDGDIDLVVGGYTQLRVLLNDGTGAFALGAPLPLAGVEYGVVAVIPHDVDGDGLLDVVVGIYEHVLPSGSYTGGVAVAFGDGAGGLTLSPTHELPLPAHRLVAADFNGDGQLDVAELGGYVSASRVDVAFGASDGSFVNSGTQYIAGSYASGLEQGDWDGDGDVDIAAGGKYSLPLLFNDGTGHFTLGGTLNPGYYTKGIAAGDLDNDGDLDLAATSGGSYAMRLYENNGSGGFTLGTTLGTTLQTLAVLLADTNGDGYLDPWTGDYSTGQVTIGASRVLVACYGQAKPNSLGCLPGLGATGTPTAGGAGLVVQAGKLLIDQPALVLASLMPGALPGLGGTLLVLPPWLEIPGVTSHGSGNPLLCDGALSLPVSGAVLGALGVGTRVYLQVLSADPGLPHPPKVSLSDGLWFEVSAP